MRNKPVFLYFIITLIVYLSGSVLLRNTTVPDIGFIILVFTSIYVGPIYGLLLGFFCGLFMDILSISPLGFHSAILVVTGYLCGKVKGKLFVDPVIVPVLIIIVATFIRTFTGYLLLLIIADNQVITFFYYNFWKKMFFTSLAAPFVYLVLRSFHLVNLNEKD